MGVSFGDFRETFWSTEIDFVGANSSGTVWKSNAENSVFAGNWYTEMRPLPETDGLPEDFHSLHVKHETFGESIAFISHTDENFLEVACRCYEERRKSET